MTNLKNAIEVKNVSKKFKNTEVLSLVNFSVSRASICGLTGNNGSGKTVLMKTICGFVKPDSGEILVNNYRIGKDCDFPQNVGVIIENPGFAQYISGINNLLQLAAIKKSIDKNQIVHTMKKVGLNPDDKKWVLKYSLGMRQRLGIAQAIMENPEILILDEPFNGLDKNGVADMRQLLIEEREKGKTILLASHNSEDIAILCDDVYEMDNGKIEKIK